MTGLLCAVHQREGCHPQAWGIDTLLLIIMLSRYIAKLGYQATLAENGRQALEKLQAEPYDLVLLDVQMPEMDGYEVLEQMKTTPRLRDIPVIMISAVEEIESVVRCIELGAQDCLPKPFNSVLLRAPLSACLERKRLRDTECQEGRLKRRTMRCSKE